MSVKPRLYLLSFLILGAFTASLAATALAQSSSSIIGTLMDPSAAVIPGGTVTVKAQATGASQTVQANEAGLFRVLNLLPGRYSLRAERAGFKALDIADIVLTSAEIRDLGRLRLELGTVDEVVSVTAEATPVQTASSERGSLVDGTQLNQVALKGRDTFGYMRLITGVVDTSADRSLANTNSVMNIFINGMASPMKNVTFDGVTMLDQAGTNAVFVNPSMDAVSEVRVLSNAFQAEYGRTSGGTINMITKSGSRDFHGSAFWQHRHEDMNANTFFNNRNGVARPRYRYFIGGGTIGGPVYIPKHFNTDKQKLFFFWSEEFTRVAQPTGVSTANLPTVAERGGDFSNSRNSAGAVITIKDPLTGQPFSGNIIPQNRIDPTGQGILNLFLKPNGYVNPAPGQQYTANFMAQETPNFERRDDIVRVDYNLTGKMLVYGRYANDKNNTERLFTASPGVGHMIEALPGHQWAWHVVNTFSPTLVNDLNIGYGHNNYLFYRTAGDVDSNYFRSTALNPPTLRPFPTGPLYQNYLPAASFAGGAASNLGSFRTLYNNIFPIPFRNFNDTYTVQDDITKAAGSHTLKAGIYFEDNHKSEPLPGANYMGSYNFGSSTNNPLDTGYGYANALLGIFQTYTEATKRLAPEGVFRQWEGYVQDNWHATRRLTVDIGVRFYRFGLSQDAGDPKSYSHFYQQLWTSANAPRLYFPATVSGKSVAIDKVTGATTYSSLVGTLIPGTGDPVNGMHVNGLTGNGDFANFPPFLASPRVGFAWDVQGNGKTAIRASFGIFYQRPDNNWMPGRGTAPTVYTGTIYYTTFAGVPQAAAAAAISPVSATSIQGDQKIAHSTQVNFTIQQSIGFDTVVDVAYVGNFNRNAVGTRQINPVPLFAYAKPENLYNGTEINANLVRAAYPGLGSINYQCNCLSDLNYHGLQVSAKRRMSHGLQFGVSYVFSKALGTQGSDPYHNDRQWYYGPLAHDRSQVFNANWVYQIPGVSNHIAKHILNNWTISGIASAQTGAPISPSCSASTGAVSVTDPTLTGATARCQVLADPKNFTQSFYTNFNTAAFGLASPGTFGNAGLGILRQPSWWNLDMTLEKRVPLGKEQRRAIRARIEAYNVLNHTEFNAIGTTMQLSGATNLNTTYGQFTGTMPARVLSTTLRFEF